MKTRMLDMFIENYEKNQEEIKIYFSPGRVNLIGEHIDYNGGLVFPAALTIGIYAAVRVRDDKLIRLRSKNIEKEIIINLEEELEYKEADDWGNYPKGVIKLLLETGYCVKGLDILFYSNLPDGAGLSSSAALEVLMAYMLEDLSGDKNINRVEIAKLCQRAENEFVGVNCGIMDQFSVALGKKDSAILLNCKNLQYEYASLNMKNHMIIIMNTNKRRELAESKYNERRKECETALSLINENLKDKLLDLCSATLEQIEKYISNETIKKRAIHVVTENNRVKEAIQSLKEGKIEMFGKLLNKSHESLKENYEVTGLHLDTIVTEALKVEGCIGARMTGAGFGGCAIAFVEKDKVEGFKEIVSKNYESIVGIKPEFYSSSIGDGVFLMN